MIKKLFVLRIGDYRPALCRYTIPTTKAWAETNGWEYHEITERKFPRCPITAEKMQIYDLAKGADWAMHVDADVMLRPDTPDMSGKEFGVFSSYEFTASKFCKGLEGRAISGGFYGAHKDCFDLWKYPEDQSTWDEYVARCHNPHIIDEFVTSKNLIENKYFLHGVCHNVDSYVVHFGSELVKDGIDTGVAMAEETWNGWLHIWPQLKTYF